MEIEEPIYEQSDPEDIQPETHNKLLNAVSQIYKKQRIDKPERREPTLQVSEFNLSSKAKNYGRIDVADLVNILKEKATHREVRQKVRSLRRKSKTLPKPMEKLHADKLRRKLGYDDVKKQLLRWEAIVQHNRAAEQLKFPLEDRSKVVIKESHDFLKTFKEPTELEKEMTAILQTSEVAEEEREQEEDLFALSLEEIIERRKMIIRMRARESYRIAKAVRQNKIKSKRYHRILKRERIKKELKDFEMLQKTNPEAALEKLEKIERVRAEERISLRHRNTGKWAKSLAIRAKYDTEARAELAEQLAKSRELTKKLNSGINSGSEVEEDDNEAEEVLKTDPTNPWKPEMEIKSFVSGFKQFQEQDAKKNEDNESMASLLCDNSLPDNSPESMAAQNEHIPKTTSDGNNEVQDNNIRSEEDLDNVDDLYDRIKTSDSNNINSSEQHLEGESQDQEDSNIEKEIMNMHDSLEENVNKKQKKKKNNSKRVKLLKPDKNRQKSPKLKIIKKNVLNEMKDESTINLINKCGKWDVSPVKENFKKVNIDDENKYGNSIDNIFDNVEVKLKQTLSNRVNKLKDNINESKRNEVNVKLQKNRKPQYQADLSFKTQKRIDIDSELIEVAVEGISTGENDVTDLLKAYASEDKVEDVGNIEPLKLLPVEPSKLNSGQLDYIEEHEECEDMEETNSKDTQLNLEEAFATDDIVEEFRREKEEEIQNSNPKEIDLSLPGWGSWSGQGIDKNERFQKKQKRKNRRLIFNFPKLPRKDDKKDYVIINEEPTLALKKHMVHDLPTPFKTVKEYEASIRAPIGNTWIPQSAFMKLIKPAVVTKLGAIIEPMDETELLNYKRNEIRKKIRKEKKL